MKEYDDINPTLGLRLPAKMKRTVINICELRNIKPGKYIRDLVIDDLIKQGVLEIDYRFKEDV